MPACVTDSKYCLRMKMRKLPRINAGDGYLKRVTRAAWAAIGDANNPPRLFLYGRSVVRLQIEEDGSPTLREITVDRLRHELARAADWFRVLNSGQQRPAPPPVDVVRDMGAQRMIVVDVASGHS